MYSETDSHELWIVMRISFFFCHRKKIYSIEAPREHKCYCSVGCMSFQLICVNGIHIDVWRGQFSQATLLIWIFCWCVRVVQLYGCRRLLRMFWTLFSRLILACCYLFQFCFFFLVMSPLFRVAIWMCLCIFVGCTICIRPNHTKWQRPNTHKHNAVAHFPPLKFNICIIQHIFHIFQLSYLLYN